MFTHVAIHYPKPQYREELRQSMRRIDAAAQGMPGLVRIGDWAEVDGGTRLVGIATWQSREHFEAAAEKLFATVANDPFDLWQERKADNLFVERD
jgi:heme-degrading monooxygenase HmoA